jgi:hypothetical protein
MFGLEYTVHADLIAVRQCGVAPSEDVDGTAAAWVLQFERCVVVAAMRGGLLHPEGCALQRDALVIEVRRLLDNRTDGDVGSIGRHRHEQPQSRRSDEQSCLAAAHRFATRTCP